MTVCTIPGCSGKVNAKGLCHKHYWRLRKYGDPLPGVSEIPRHAARKPCSVEGCGRLSRRNGLCEMHDARMKARGTTDAPAPRVVPSCSIPECNRPHVADGYCGAHYQRVQKYGDPRANVPLRVHHGHARTVGVSPTYESYRAMLERCRNPKRPDWKYYAGRGITVGERWCGPEGFANFLADMGERPAGLTLDRSDPFGNYEPGNCRWATRAEQARNQRRYYTSGRAAA